MATLEGRPKDTRGMSELAYNIVWSEAFSLYFNTHDTQPSYRIIQVNEFVCLVDNKHLFDGLIGPYDSSLGTKF